MDVATDRDGNTVAAHVFVLPNLNVTRRIYGKR